MKRHVLLVAGLLLLNGAAMASTTDIASHRRADFYAPGTHQFYMWCAENQDRIVSEKGQSAIEAMARLGKPAACHFTWQGRISS